MGLVVTLVAVVVGWLIYLVPTDTGVPKETSPEAAWLVASPGLVGAGAMFVLGLASVLSRENRDRLLGLAWIAGTLVLAWAVIAVVFFGGLVLLLSSSEH